MTDRIIGTAFSRARLFLSILIIGTLLLLTAPTFAQEKDVDVIKVNTDLVVFDVQVIDKKTKRVIAISPKKISNFRITEPNNKSAISAKTSYHFRSFYCSM